MKSLSSVVCSALLLAAVNATAATQRPVTSFKSSKPAARVVPKLRAPNVVLYDQTGTPGVNGTSSQDFEPAFDPFDDMAADDFTIPAATNWSITGATFTGVYFAGPGPMPSMNVTFYNNAAGLPGSVACPTANVVPTLDVAGTVTVAFPPCNLGPGTYWISAQSRMDFGVGGQWGWIGSTVQAANGAVWQNPGGGFGACPTWAPVGGCVAGADPDLSYQITGTIVPSVLTCQVGSNYVTATTAGTIVPGVVDTGNHTDDGTTNVPLPFPVAFYDQVFNSINVDSNGTAQFVSATSSFTNSCLPAPPAFDTLILPHWDDLMTDVETGCAAYPGGVCGIFTDTTGSAPNRVFHIEWRAVYFASTATTANFELRLHEDNANFEVVYGTLAGGGTSATAGAQRDTGSLFTEFACNTALPDNTQVSYTCTLVPVELTGFTVQ